MPELPEVEVVRAGLEPFATAARIDAVTVLDVRSLRRHLEGPDDFIHTVHDARITAVSRRGKFLWLPLELSHRVGRPPRADAALVIHLGMSGHLLVDASGTVRHERVRFDLATPSGAVRLSFVDQRIFGYVAVDRLVATPDAPQRVPAMAAHIARDPLDPLFDEAKAARRISASASAIKRVVLDQTVISGVGNIYADEALWAARIHPETAANTLGDARIRTLIAALREVMSRALGEGGTSFDTLYRHVNGASGYFSRQLSVYGREGEPCPRCGRAIVRLHFMNRSSHVCAHCQWRRPDRAG